LVTLGAARFAASRIPPRARARGDGTWNLVVRLAPSGESRPGLDVAEIPRDPGLCASAIPGAEPHQVAPMGTPGGEIDPFLRRMGLYRLEWDGSGLRPASTGVVDRFRERTDRLDPTT